MTETATILAQSVKEGGQVAKCKPPQLAGKEDAIFIPCATEDYQKSARVSPTGVATAPPGPSNDVVIEFDNDDAPVSARDRKALVAAIDANARAGRGAVVIYAARGGDGNIFERASLADRRARLVKKLLPPAMVRSIEFDPEQADDTVRIEFVPSS